jgi:hypothetical protein
MKKRLGHRNGFLKGKPQDNDWKEGIYYVNGDCSAMSDEWTNKFDVVIDKATLDSILCSEEGAKRVHEVLQSITQVMRDPAVFISVSNGEKALRFPCLDRPGEPVDGYGWTVKGSKAALCETSAPLRTSEKKKQIELRIRLFGEAVVQARLHRV